MIPPAPEQSCRPAGRWPDAAGRALKAAN